MRSVVKSAQDNGYGIIFVGITDAFSDGQFKYWSSAKDYNETGAAWQSHANLDGVATGSNPPIPHDCGCIVNGGLINDTTCEASYFALCELTHIIC